VANSFNDLSQMLAPLGPTLPPQVLAASGNGLAVDVRKIGMNIINAVLFVGDATALTSLDVKMQASPDGTTGWVDITGATFTQVTADPGATSVAMQVVPFNLPTVPSSGATPYQFVRAVATLVGTSINVCVGIFGCRKYDGNNAYQNAPGNDGGNVVN